MSISFASTSESISRPPFIMDGHSIMRDGGRQVDWDAMVGNKYQHGAATVKLAAAIAIDDTTVAVDALTKILKAGTTLYFGEAKEMLYIDADAAVGDTSISFTAAPAVIEDDDEAYYGGTGGKFLRAGTIVDLLSSGKIIPSAEATAGVTAYGVLLTNADEDSPVDAATGYGVITQGMLFDNLLPEYAHASLATWKTELLARGGAWMFSTYADNT